MSERLRNEVHEVHEQVAITSAEGPHSKPKLYFELAEWWPLLSPPGLYAEEAAFYQQQLLGTCQWPCRTLLELGSGGGNNASHLKKQFDITLLDLSQEMIAVSRKLNPECEHHVGDMRHVRLGRTFDCLFIHDAIAYMTSEIDLRRAMDTAYIHCRPGGAALFAPNFVRETFNSATDHGGSDGPHRSLRYLEWRWDPNPEDETYVIDYAFLMREEDGTLRVQMDHHVEGLFGRNQWLQMLTAAGFEARSLLLNHSHIEPGTYELFVCTRPR
ncbi:MAG: class I SAM-dependent methyltransferase [Acidobacteria bacterium]|nr:MAG: class I SAM-dependent methyltransferase [Acidobacteriota bacterium]